MPYRSYSEDELRQIFNRTSGKCHLCFEPLTFEAYGQGSGTGAWEVDHSRPKARGGTNHGNNLYPAHPWCNRRRGAKSARTVRAENGYTRPPFSVEERQRFKNDRALGGGMLGAFGAAMVGLGPLGVIGGAFFLADVGYGLDPDELEATDDRVGT